MHFHSLEFAIFFCVVALLVFGFSVSKFQKLILVAASLYFYSWEHWPYAFLLVFSTCLDFVLAQKIYSSEGRSKKTYLYLSLLGNLGLLCFFKYLGFFNGLLLDAGVGFENLPKIALPIGISFYTFQTMSYSIDVYRGQMEPCRNIGHFALYVSFFPQLIAGPIVRAKDFLPQLKEKIAFKPVLVVAGLELVVLGLFKKAMGDVLFNSLSDVGNSDSHHGLWIMYYAYAVAFHIYLDFSGYSHIAIGLAKCFGLQLPDNFRFPFVASSFSELWHRWHITLSTWMRDYLYIPLGGNRCGKIRQGFNLMATMTLSGLWHGASLNFVLWGFVHGLFLQLEKLKCWKFIFRWRWLGALFVFHVTAFLFVIFHIKSFAVAKGIIGRLRYSTEGVMTPALAMGLMVLVGALVVHVLAYRNEKFGEKVLGNPVLRTVLVFVAFFLALVFLLDTPNVYFKF